MGDTYLRMPRIALAVGQELRGGNDGALAEIKALNAERTKREVKGEIELISTNKLLAANRRRAALELVEKTDFEKLPYSKRPGWTKILAVGFIYAGGKEEERKGWRKEVSTMTDVRDSDVRRAAETIEAARKQQDTLVAEDDLKSLHK